MNGMKIALIVSICLNVFVLGAVAGGLVLLLQRGQVAVQAAGTQLAATPAAPRPPLAQAAAALPAPSQQAFRKSLRQTRQDLAPAVAQGAADRAELVRLLGQPQLDRDAIDAALDKARQDDLGQRQKVEAAVVDFVATLNPQERRAFVQRLEANGSLRALRAARIAERAQQKPARTATDRAQSAR